MKFRLHSVILLICLIFYSSVALSQNGAMISRGEYLWGGAVFNGENVMVLFGSDSEAFCQEEPGYLSWIDFTEVLRPDGTVKYHDKGHFFTRVFYPATWDDFGEDPDFGHCDLWYDETKLIGEGIVNSVFNDNHVNAYSVPHKRRNVWGFNLSGTIYDMSGLCSSGMMDLNTVRRWKMDKDFPACLPDDCDFPVQVWKGPDISCYQSIVSSKLHGAVTLAAPSNNTYISSWPLPEINGLSKLISALRSKTEPG